MRVIVDLQDVSPTMHLLRDAVDMAQEQARKCRMRAADPAFAEETREAFAASANARERQAAAVLQLMDELTTPAPGEQHERS